MATVTRNLFNELTADDAEHAANEAHDRHAEHEDFNGLDPHLIRCAVARLSSALGIHPDFIRARPEWLNRAIREYNAEQRATDRLTCLIPLDVETLADMALAS